MCLSVCAKVCEWHLCVGQTSVSVCVLQPKANICVLRGGGEFLCRAHVFLIFPYTFMRHFCIFRGKKNLRENKKGGQRGEIKRKSVFPVEMSDQRAGLFHNQPG